MSDVLEERTEGRLRILRMNRPERKNALNGELLAALDSGLRAAAHDESVWAIALTAAGSGGTGITSQLVLDGLYARGVQ